MVLALWMTAPEPLSPGSLRGPVSKRTRVGGDEMDHSESRKNLMLLNQISHPWEISSHKSSGPSVSPSICRGMAWLKTCLPT